MRKRESVKDRKHGRGKVLKGGCYEASGKTSVINFCFFDFRTFNLSRFKGGHREIRGKRRGPCREISAKSGV